MSDGAVYALALVALLKVTDMYEAPDAARSLADHTIPFHIEDCCEDEEGAWKELNILRTMLEDGYLREKVVAQAIRLARHFGDWYIKGGE